MESLHGSTISESFQRECWKKHQIKLMIRLQPLDIISLFIRGVAKTHCLLLELARRCTDWVGVFCTAVPKAPWRWSCYRGVQQLLHDTHGTEVEWHGEHRLFYCRKQWMCDVEGNLICIFYKFILKKRCLGKKKSSREMESWIKRVLNQFEENYWLFISGHCI